MNITEFLNKLIDDKVEITLTSEKKLIGKLLAYDSNLNLIVQEEKETKPLLIRGSNLLSIK